MQDSTETTRTDHQALTDARRAAALRAAREHDERVRDAWLTFAGRIGSLIDSERVGTITTAWDDAYRNGASQLERF